MKEVRLLKYGHRRSWLWCCALLFVLLTGCSERQSLQNGIWRAQLSRPDGKNITFRFEVSDSNGLPVMDIFNAEERLRVDSITKEGDSLIIRMPFFDSYFTVKPKGNNALNGIWTKNYVTRIVRMPFHADIEKDVKEPDSLAPDFNIEGTWETNIEGSGSQIKAIGVFKQKGPEVTGTFLTPTGDFRYLSGKINGDTLTLTGFDGAHALLFSGVIKDGDQIDGQLYSQNRDVMTWQATKRSYEKLPEAYAAGDIRPGTVKLDFRLKDMRTNKMVSLSDSAYRGKVIVLSVLGSWCPNCMDEAPFLTSYYKENRQKGFEIIGIDFEETPGFEESKQALNSFFNHFDIQYPILFSGVAYDDPDLTKKVFPALPVQIAAFPTSIFIDKSGFVRKILSGFNGPATGKYYEQSKEAFDGIVNSLLAE